MLGRFEILRVAGSRLGCLGRSHLRGLHSGRRLADGAVGCGALVARLRTALTRWCRRPVGVVSGVPDGVGDAAAPVRRGRRRLWSPVGARSWGRRRDRCEARSGASRSARPCVVTAGAGVVVTVGRSVVVTAGAAVVVTAGAAVVVTAGNRWSSPRRSRSLSPVRRSP